jgi:hypothetical protein
MFEENERDDPDFEEWNRYMWLLFGTDLDPESRKEVELKLHALTAKRSREREEFERLAEAAGHPLVEPILTAGTVTEDPRTPEARTKRLAESATHVKVDPITRTELVHRPDGSVQIRPRSDRPRGA